MIKDINKDIQKLLAIKEEIENKHIKEDTIYYIASLDTRPHIEDYRG